jgi:glutathione S-transferase
MLKEIGVDFKEHVLNLREGEQKTPAMLKMNPFGKAPVLKDGSFTLFESMAIMNYLGDKHPDSGLVPKSGTAERALYDQWMSFCISDLEQPMWRITKHTFLFPEKMRIPQDVELAKEEFRRVAKVVDEQIGSKKFLVGNRFTAADITMTYTLGWASRFDLLAGLPNCQRYRAEHTSREAFPKHLFTQ